MNKNNSHKPIKKTLRLLFFLIALLFFVSCKQSNPQTPTAMEETASTAVSTTEPDQTEVPTEPVEVYQGPDLIFYNADILTMDVDNPTASAIAVAGDSIVAVGSDTEILQLEVDNHTQVVDLQGLTITPGFIDSHSHRITQRHNWCLNSVAEASQEALSMGWTGSVELCVNQGELNDMTSADAAGDLRIRVNAYLAVNATGQTYVPGNDSGWYNNYQPLQQFSSYLRVAGLKLFLDDNAGRDLLWKTDDLNDFVYNRQTENWQIAFRTMSTESHYLGLNSIKYALDDESPVNYRHRFEHSMCSDPSITERMEELKVIASIQPDWPAVIWQVPIVKDYVRNDNDIAVVDGGEESGFRWRDYINSEELIIAASACNASSCAYAGGIESLECYDYSHISPMGLIYRNVSQVGTGDIPPESWMKSRSSLTVEELLPLLTINGAYATFEEDQKGSLTPGKWADLVVLSSNPLDIDEATNPEDLLDIKVFMTMVGGQVEYCGDPQGVLCLDADNQRDFSAARGSWVAEDVPDNSPMTLEITENHNNSFNILWIDRAANACSGNCFRGVGSGPTSDYVLNLDSFPCHCPATGAEFEVTSASFIYNPNNDTITMDMDFFINDSIVPYSVLWHRE